MAPGTYSNITASLNNCKYEYIDEAPSEWKKYSKLKMIMYILVIISFISIILLPLEVVKTDKIYANPKSLSYLFVFFLCILCSIFWFGWLLTNKDKKISRKYYPMFAFIITGSLVIDQVFQIPGSGRVFQQAINCRDYPVIMGMTCLLSLILIVLTLVSDILYKVANPRVDFD